MRRRAAVLLVCLIWGSLAIADLHRPLTVEERVTQADLIVVGKATAFGPTDPANHGRGDLYKRHLRIDVKDVVWSPTPTNISELVLSYDILEVWPRSWWDYTNTPGVFFLKKGRFAGQWEWDDGLVPQRVEPLTNALGVLVVVEHLRGKSSLTVLRPPEFSYPKDTRYDSSQKLRLAYLSSLRDGYYDALAGKQGLLMFAPSNEVDSARVLGYADGQVSGNRVRMEWIRKANELMR